MHAELLSSLRDAARLHALAETELLDSPQEARFDRYTKLAAKLLGAPGALVSLVDDHRQFFKSAIGLQEPWASRRETPLSHSFCKHAVAANEEFVVEDALTHPLVHDNGAITDLGVHAYAGIPLEYGGQTIGAFCVVDSSPRVWTDDELDTLRVIAASVNAEIALLTTRRELREQQALVSALTESALDVIISADAKGEILFCNQAVEQVFLRSPDQLRGRQLVELMPERYRQAHVAGLARVAAGGESRLIGRVVELVGLRANGEEFPLELSVSSWSGRIGTFYTAVIRDATERARTLRKLHETEAQLRLTIDRAPIGMAMVSPDGHWLRVNDALCEILGYSSEELLRTDFQHLTHPEDLEADVALRNQLLAGSIPSYQMQKRYLHSDGHCVWAQLSVTLVRDDDGAPSFFISQVQDITQQRELELQVRQASLTDELTGLQNRRGFMLLAEQQLCTAGRYGRPLVVLFADLNGMKQINDQLGHEEGDRALIDMAKVLRTTFRGADIAARLGGDEFVVLAEGDAQFAEFAKQRIEHNVQLHNEAGGRPYKLSAAVGFAVYDAAHAKSLAELLSSADKLMYDAKRKLRLDRASLAQSS